MLTLGRDSTILERSLGPLGIDMSDSDIGFAARRWIGELWRYALITAWYQCSQGARKRHMGENLQNARTMRQTMKLRAEKVS